MKLHVVLLVALVITQVASKSDAFYEDVPKQMMKGMTEMMMTAFDDMPVEEIRMILDNSTGSGFREDIDSMLMMLKNDFCMEMSEGCEATFLGCSCRKSFAMLGDGCSNFPCRVMSMIYKDGAAIVKDFQNVDSFEKIVDLLMNKMVSPLMGMMCECNDEGLFKAVTQCVKNYDSAQFPKEALEEYRYVVSEINFKSIDELLTVIVGSMCLDDPNKAGAQCYSAVSQSAVLMGSWLDNTYDPSFDGDKCHTFRRLKKPMMKFFKVLVSQDWSDLKPSSLGSNIKRILKEEKRLVRAFYCSKSCYIAVIDTFEEGACCGYAIQDYLIENKISKLMLKVAKNIFTMAVSGDLEFPKISHGFITKIMEGMDPSTCGEKEVADAYKDVKNECSLEDF